MPDDVPDLRPSPWPAHFTALTLLGAVYLLFAVSTWPSQRDTLSANLTIIVIGLFGAAYLGFSIVVTAILFALRPRRLWRAWAYALAAGAATLLSFVAASQLG